MTINLSISYWLLFSALAIADETVFLISLVILFAENCNSLIATSTFFPTIALRIGLSFLTLDLILLFTDLTVSTLTLLIFFFFIHSYFLTAVAGLAFLSAGV